MHGLRWLLVLSLAGWCGAQLPLGVASVVPARPGAGCRVLPGSLPNATARLQSGLTWPGGIVPYRFDSSVTPAMAASMAAAMQEITSRIRVQFVVRALEVDHVVIRDSIINSSPIGRMGGAQILHIANWNQRFEMVHALMHVLGFWHEHQRPDRDQMVSVQFANVDPARAQDFQLVPVGNTYGLPYDFDSVTHFGGTEAGVGGATTIVVLPPNQAQQAAIGQRTHLSLGDIEALRRTYGSLLPPSVTSVTPSSVPSYLPPPIIVDGQLFDEATRVLLNGVQVNFALQSPTRLQLVLPQLSNIGACTLVVESGAGPSAPAAFTITGNSPPLLVTPPVIGRTVPLPFRTYSDVAWANIMVAAFDNVPSIAPGIVQLGLGNQFTTLAEVTRGVAGPNGLWTVNLLATGLPVGTVLFLQCIAFDPSNPTLPLPVTTTARLTVF